MTQIKVSGKEYNTIHQWNLRHWVKEGQCSNCSSTSKTEWSNISGTYKRDKSDWQEVCRKCHIYHDKTLLNRPYGKRGKDKAKRKSGSGLWKRNKNPS